MRKSIALFLTLFVIGLTTVGCAPADAQQTRTLHDDQWCDHDNWEHDNNGERYCEVREITLAAGRDLIAVDGRRNGGIKVEGWNRKEILVRAKVHDPRAHRSRRRTPRRRRRNQHRRDDLRRRSEDKAERRGFGELPLDGAAPVEPVAGDL